MSESMKYYYSVVSDKRTIQVFNTIEEAREEKKKHKDSEIQKKKWEWIKEDTAMFYNEYEVIE